MLAALATPEYIKALATLITAIAGMIAVSKKHR